MKPLHWISQYGLRVGATIDLLLAEMNVQGVGTVVSIEACPSIASGEGNVVTGRYITRRATNLVELTLSDGSQIEGTETHPIWIPSLHQWILMGELTSGLMVDTKGDPLFVTSVRALTASKDVYNVEVQGDHVYRVGQPAILVHNTGGGDCPDIPDAPKVTVTAGGNFKSHFIRHKSLLEDLMGRKYPKFKTDGGAFLDDIGKAIATERVKLIGQGTLKNGQATVNIYRGNGVTIVTKLNGEFVTILESGTGLDLGIVIP